MLLVGENLTGVKPFRAYVKETSTVALNVEQGNHLSSTTYGASEQDVWYAAADLSIYSTKHLREHSKLFVTQRLFLKSNCSDTHISACMCMYMQKRPLTPTPHCYCPIFARYNA